MASATRTKTKTKKKPAPRRPPSGRARAARERADRRLLRTRLVAAALVAVLAGFLIYQGAQREQAASDGSQESTCERNDTPGGNPPVGGEAADDPAEPGFYRDGAPPPSDASLVKAMRQGFVVLWYKPALAEEQMAEVEALSDGHGRELIVVPRRSMFPDVAVTAWGKRLVCTPIDADAVSEFTREHKDKGPEKGFL